ncbi:MAG: hypothetical protein AB3N23_07865, partial [Paracoccaceae bacterium]
MRRVLPVLAMLLGLLLPTVQQVAAGTIVGTSESAASSVVAEMEGGADRCLDLDTVYQFDCFRQSYKSASSELRHRIDYQDAKTALEVVEEALDDILRRNRDRSQQTIRVNGKTYKAIKPEAVAAASRSFQAARQEA